jgi:CRISPR-associated exonuclease Cas4
LGSRDLRDTIEKSFDKLYQDLSLKIDKNNPDRIHALEAAGCTRLAYYDRKDPIPPEASAKTSILLSSGMRRAMQNIRGEYRVDSLSLEVDVDMMIADDYLVRFEVVRELPEVPHPRHMLYLNACLFALKKDEGFLIYMNADGKTAEFSVTRNNRMFEEIVRRARVLSTLLKENKTPIVEPSELCTSCRYFERCYAKKQDKEDQSVDILAQIFGKGKK